MITGPECSTCGRPYDPVFCAETGKCSAWYCTPCNCWTTAIGRERLITEKDMLVKK